jgi:predicted acylesterase/phospholipase RssA
MTNMIRSAVGLVMGIAAAVIMAGCGPAIQRNPVPDWLVENAMAVDAELYRFWGDAPVEGMNQVLDDSRLEKLGDDQTHHYLAVSGGSSNGAYGAGFLNGWTAAGTRPTFNLVTGISTGALIAPFAFLGPDFDDELKSIFTEFSTDDLVKKRGVFKILPNASVYDTSLIRDQIAMYITRDIVDRIATEYQAGRLLYIGTTNLDAGRPVIWSIGRIAASDDPDALDLIHDIILASASIGGAFPPVLIEVEVDGETYDEMHVDGGTTNQVFIYPMGVDWAMALEKIGVDRPPKVYILRNGFLNPPYAPVDYKLAKILGQSVNSLIRSQAQGDIEEVFLQTQRDGLEFYMTSIPDEFHEPTTELFDTAYMKKLFDAGYKEALGGDAWERSPPGYDVR